MTDPVLPLKGDSTKHVIEAGAATVAIGLAAAEGFSSLDKAVPEGIHEATPEAGNDSVESVTSLNEEPQREREVDVTTVPETEDTPEVAPITTEAITEVRETVDVLEQVKLFVV